MAVIEKSKTLNEPGVYKHPETGAEVVVNHHPKFGSAMADGFVAVGFVWQGSDDKAEKKKAKAADKAEEGSSK